MFKSTAFALAAALVPFSVGFADQPSKALIDSDYQQMASTSCNGNSCELDFPPTSAHVTEITNISCFTGLLADGTRIQYAALSGIAVGGNYGGPFFVLQSFVLGTTEDNFALGLNGSTKLFFTAGITPYVNISFFSPTLVTFSCTISGYAHA